VNDRMSWLVADVTCLLCGRRLGSLVGWGDARASAKAHQFVAFKSAVQGVAFARFDSRNQLRCSACGGTGVVDELERLTPRGQASSPLLARPRRRSAPQQRRLRRMRLLRRAIA
jgi:hypothetical protein